MACIFDFMIDGGRGANRLGHLMKSILLLLLLPIAGFAKELYSMHDLSEEEIQQTYVRVLLESCQRGDEVWHEVSGAPDEGYWGAGKSGEDGTRANSGMVLASAALLKYSDSLTATERHDLLRKSFASLRYATA